MRDKGDEDSSYAFLPLILLVGLILVYLGSLFALAQIVVLRDAVFGEFRHPLSPRESSAINVARMIRQYWPFSLLPVFVLVVIHLLVRKSRVKVILYLVLMAVVMILTVVGLALVTRLPVRVAPEGLATVFEGGIFYESSCAFG